MKASISTSVGIFMYLCGLISATAVPGDLDPAFAGTGKLTMSVRADDDSRGHGVAIQNDGKIVVAGFSRVVVPSANSDFAVLRFNPDGSLDATFGNAGEVVTDLGSASDEAWSVALQPDGRIVCVGRRHNGTNHDFAIVRYEANGTLDPTFNGTGIVVTDFGGPGLTGDAATCLAVQTDGKIVVGGIAWNGVNFDFALARYHTNGALDTSFGNGGKLTTQIGDGSDECHGIVIQADGSIVAAGSSNSGPTSTYFAVVRYLANGTLDTSFNGSGKVVTDFGGASCWGRGVALQGTGKIVVGGHSFDGFRQDFAMVRYNSDGSVDPTFGVSGKVRTSFAARGSVGDTMEGMAIQSNNRILVSGHVQVGSRTHFAVARYLPDGTLDAGFGSEGMVTTEIANGGLYPTVALQEDNKVVLAGWANVTGNGEDFAIVRYAGGGLITHQPASWAGAQGQPALFAVQAAGAGSLAYQWQKDGVDIPGATGSTFSITSTQPWHIGDYTVRVTDANGAVTSNAATLSLSGINSGIWRGLIGYYELDGSSVDLSPFTRNGNNFGTTNAADRFGVAGRASYFDGSSYISVSTSPVTGQNPFSVSFWASVEVQALNNEGWQVVFGQPSANQAFHVGNRGYGATNMYGGFWANTTLANTPFVTFSYNQYFQFVATFDGAKVNVYKNGDLVGSSTQDLSGVNLQGGNMQFGKQLGGTNEYFKGSLDSVRIYNRALSVSEVRLLFESEDPDTDGDGIRDRFETGTGVFVSPTNTGTNPTVADTDGDGLSDGQEINIHSSNPHLKDTDGDGFEDGFEVLTGFNPALPTSTPEALSAMLPAVEFRFNAANGVSYRIESSTDLTNWSTIENSIAGAGVPVIRFYTTDGITRKFYRARRN